MFSNSKLMESIIEVNIESNIRVWTMVGNHKLVDDPEITTNAHIWDSCFGGNSDVEVTANVEGTRK